MNVGRLNQLLAESGIRVTGVYHHSKASESYVDVEITASDNGIIWEGSIPYQYRRTGLSLGTEEAVANYLVGIKEHFTDANIKGWVERERKYWEDNFAAPVTTPFFDLLLSMD